MSRENLMEMIDDVKKSFTSEQYKKIVEEIARMKPIGKKLELKILYPICRPVSQGLFIKTNYNFASFKIIIDQNMLSNEHWELWNKKEAGVMKLSDLVDHVPEEYQDVIRTLINTGYSHRHRVTIAHIGRANEEIDDVELDESSLIDIDVVTEIDEVYVTITEKS